LLANKKRISKEIIIIGELENIHTNLTLPEAKIIEVPWTQVAEEIGNKIYSNVVAAGVIAQLFDIDDTIAKDYLQKRFARKWRWLYVWRRREPLYPHY